MDPSFDPARSVAFDLEQGSVELSDGSKHALVPVEALAALVAGKADGRWVGRAIGRAAAERAARRAGDLRKLAFEKAVEHFGGEIALLGFGNLRAERWGNALVFALEPCAFDARADAFLAGVIEGAMGFVSEGREVAACVVERTGELTRILVGNESAVERARREVQVGAFFPDIVGALHAPRGVGDGR